MAGQHFGKAYGGKPPVNYERFFVPAIGAPLAAELVRAAALRPGERVLDVACGTGVVARLAAQRTAAKGTVAGLDVNAGMLAVAKSVTPPGLGIDWHEASAEAMPFPDASFDVVLCQMGLQFMPDHAAALAEMRRVLAPGGRILLNLPGPTPELFAVMAEALARHVGPPAAGFVHHVFSLHDAAEIERLLADAGFDDASAQTDTITLRLPPPAEFLWQYVSSTPLAGTVGELDDDTRQAMERDVVPRWQGLMRDGALTLQVRVVTATGRS